MTITVTSILNTLQTAPWTSDAFYVAVAWTIGAVVWVVAFMAGVVATILDGDSVAELIMWVPFWAFLCLLMAFFAGAGWYLWLGLSALVGCGFLLSLIIKAMVGSTRCLRA